ncbi:MAG: hypothetical protein ACRES6_06610 [Steroidobacteraceae bacterium]
MSVLSRRAATAGAVLTGLMFGLAGLGAAQSVATNPQGQPATDVVVPAGKAVAAGGGRIVLKGPGYSIVATSPPVESGGETKVTNAPLETLHEPIVCQGQRELHIDNRDIRFDGNAITAEDGCEVHITNSRISAGGIAIRARGATVHIENSDIEGHAGAIDASDGAQIYAETSTFKGAARRVGEASIHDLGNNTWQ